LISLLTIANVDSPEAGWIVEAPQFDRAMNSDFRGALLWACAQSEGCDAATLDKGIVQKFSEVAVLTPTECLSGKAQGKNEGELT
jgi:hypothetical protein